jgi:hypothetical protein
LKEYDVALADADLSEWDVSSVTDFTWLFKDTSDEVRFNCGLDCRTYDYPRKESNYA